MKRRLDLELVARGMAQSRERARALILAGDVRVNDAPVTKAGTPVDADVPIVLRQPDHPWASRGGLKLAHALETFPIPVTGRQALDLGASTGGFTDVLLSAGAASVVAVDVGRGQLHWRLRTDARVTVLDGINARYLSPADLPQGRQTFDIITIDVSFISLRHIFPVARSLLAPGGDIVALVKPQFEAGRHQVGKGGIVRDPAVHACVLAETAARAAAAALAVVRTIASPIEGSEGNKEFLAHLRAAEPAAS